MIYTIHSMLKEKFEKRLLSFQKKFEKYGDGELKYSISEPYVYEYDSENEDSVPEYNGKEVCDISVEGEYKIKGYEFVAALRYNSASRRNIVSGNPIPEKFISRCECDHCKTKRVRLNTILLKKDDEFIQVGTACVKDYLGVNIERYASYLAFMSQLEEDVEDAKMIILKSKDSLRTEEVLLETAKQFSDHGGYISKDRAFELGVDSTASVVWNEIHNAYHTYSDKEKDLVEKVKTLVNKAEDDFGYVSNLKSLVNNTFVTNKDFGLVVSSFGFYAREMARLQREEENKKTENSDWIGTVGDRIEFIAQPKLICSFEGQWGVSYMYFFNVDENKVVWSTTKTLDEDVVYKVTGRVKAHSTYRDKKQTEITRCKLALMKHTEE